MRIALLLPVAASALLASAAFADTGSNNRGIWFWNSPASPFGSDNIVGAAAAENQTLSTLQSWGITHLYGSYGGRPVTDPAAIAAWNQKLSAAGIESQLLLSENTWIFPANRSALLTLLQTRLLDFNAAEPASADFAALHLDIEPQGLSQWSTWTTADKRNALDLLLGTFQDCRAYLDTHGGSSIPVYADLPVWFDSLTAIGWTDAADRDAWFTDLGQPLAGISLMAYERTTYSSISNSVSYEFANFPGTSRVALEADIGPAATWPDLAAFTTMADTVETASGPSAGIDIHSYHTLSESLPEPATLSLLAIAALPLLTRRPTRPRI